MTERLRTIVVVSLLSALLVCLTGGVMLVYGEAFKPQLRARG